MFFKRKETPLNSEEYEKLRKLITEVKADVLDLDKKLQKTYDEFHSFRGKVYKNKQLDEKSEDLNTNNSIFLT